MELEAVDENSLGELEENLDVEDDIDGVAGVAGDN